MAREIAAVVILIEAHHHQIAVAGIAIDADVIELDLEPRLAGIHILFMFRPRVVLGLARGKAPRVVRQIFVGVEAFPITPPGFNGLREFLPLCARGLRVGPLHAVGDDHRRAADLHTLEDLEIVLIGHCHATIAGARRAAIGIKRHAVHPDAAAGARAALVPFVGIIQRQGAHAVLIRQLAVAVVQTFARDIAGDVIHAQRRFVVTLAQLVHATLADGDIVIRDVARFAALVFVYVER